MRYKCKGKDIVGVTNSIDSKIHETKNKDVETMNGCVQLEVSLIGNVDMVNKA